MKNFLFILAIFVCSTSSFAQYTPTPLQQQPTPAEEEKEATDKKFDPNRLVIGGVLGASFGTYTFVNVSPQVGYMFNKYLTAGAGLSYLYNSYKPNESYKESYNFAGLNLFARVFPVRFLYISAQPEINYSWGKITYFGQTENQDGKWIPVALVGAGAFISPNGRSGMMIGIHYDLIQNSRSPYGTNPFLNIGFAF